MARLSKATIQKLAVLRALSLWKHGAHGPVRLQKIMFAADFPNARKLFTFQKYYLGQYSEEISAALNSLRAGGWLTSQFDGPAERLEAVVSAGAADKIRSLFTLAFPKWENELKQAFSKWGHLPNDKILKQAHDDVAGTKTVRGQLIFESNLPAMVDVAGVSPAAVEELTVLVDERFTHELRQRLGTATKIPATSTDWRGLYFGESAPRKKAL
jgi:hypothetical protein